MSEQEELARAETSSQARMTSKPTLSTTCCSVSKDRDPWPFSQFGFLKAPQPEASGISHVSPLYRFPYSLRTIADSTDIQGF